MNRQLKKIMNERYGKFVLVGMILIGLYYFFTIQSGISNWYATRNYQQSDMFRQEYEAYPDSYTEFWEDDQPVYYKSIEDYIKGTSYLFNKANQPDSLTTRGDKAIDKATTYTNVFMSEGTGIFLVAFFLLGFLLFFVDLKTHFNTFLFSLGTTRNAIFKEKFKTVALPLFTVLILCKLAFITSLYLFIPHEFINAHLSTLLLSMINGLLCIFFYFSCGVFIGILTGNLIFGPVIAGAFLISTTLLSSVMMNVLFFIENRLNRNLNSTYEDYGFQIDIGKVNVHPGLCITIFIISALLLFISWRVFNQLSLEKSSQNILLDSYRLPITLLIIVYSCTIVWATRFMYALMDYPEQHADVPYFISRSLVSGGIISLITVGTIYFVPLKNRVRKLLEKRRQFKEFKVEE